MQTRMWPLRRGRYTILTLGGRTYKGLSGAWVEVDSPAAVAFMGSVEWVTYDIEAGADQTEITAPSISILYPMNLDLPVLEPGGWELTAADVLTTLGVLSLSSNIFIVGGVQGDLVGVVIGATLGSSVSIGSLSIPDSIQIVPLFDSWLIQVGPSPPDMPEIIVLSLTETLADATNTPRTTRGLVVSVNAPVVDFLNLGLNLTVNSVPLMF